MEQINTSNQAPTRVQTLGDGNCAFHAIFGTWDPSSQQYICQDVPAKRARLAEAIKASKKGEALFALTQVVIQHLIQDINPHQNLGPIIKALRVRHDEFNREHEQKTANKLNKLLETINSNVDLKHLLDFFPEATLKLKFDQFRARQETELRRYLDNDHNLKRALEEYDFVSNETFNWEFSIDELTINEYVKCFINRDRTYLLPLEVQMIAHAFDVTIHYYNFYENKIYYQDTYNPKLNNTNTVSICFNGHNHFERIVNQSEYLLNVREGHLTNAQYRLDFISQNELKSSKTEMGANFFNQHNNSKKQKNFIYKDKNHAELLSESNSLKENESTSQLTSSVTNLTKKVNNYPKQIIQNCRGTHLILLRKQLLLEKLQSLTNAINNQKVNTPFLNSALIQQLTSYKAKLDTIDDTCIQAETDEKSYYVMAAQKKIKSMREFLIRLRDKKIAKREKAYAEINDDILAWLKPALNELIAWATLSRVKPGELPPTVEALHKTDLLRYQQNQATACPDFYQLLRTIHQLAKKDEKKKSVFISYAWPSPEREDYEDWVQDFLLIFKQHLEDAHLRVLLDLTNSCNGYNSYRHMDEILECDYVILIGTESLLDKHQNNDTAGISAISTELNWIREKRIKDAKRGLYRVIPLIVSGDINESIPIEYKRYTVIESFYSQGYTGTVVKLLGHILGYEKYQPFVNAYKTFQQQRPEYNNQPSPFATIEATHQPDIQQEPLEQKGQNYAVNVMQGKSTAFQSLQSRLKTIYRQHAGEFRRLFDKKPHYIKEHYINLALIEQEKIIDQVNQLLDHSIPVTQNFSHHEMTNMSISLNELFTTCKPHEDLYHLAIYGGAGVGKSTLCQAIAYKWATDETFWQDQFSAIFWIKLRDLTDPKLNDLKTVAELIAYLCFDKNSMMPLEKVEVKILEQLISNRSKAKPFLLILDGYDELPQQLWQTLGNEKRLKSPIDKLFLHSHVIVTSRPQSEIPFKNQQTLEVLGLQPAQIRNYVDKFFGENEVSKNKLKQYLEQNSILNNLAQIPLNLELICSIWKDEKNLSEQLTLTQLYEKLVHFIIKRYIENHTPEKTTLGLSSQALEKKIERNYDNWLCSLEKLAWDMFGGDTTDFENAAIHIYCDNHNFAKLFNENDTEYFDKVNLLINKCGFLRPVAGREGSDDRQAEFIHLTFQEFFAARHAAKIIQSVGTQGNTAYESLQTFFKHNKSNPKLQIVWWFIAGLLKDDSKSLNRYFSLLLQQPRNNYLFNDFPLFINCLEQSNLGGNSKVAKLIADNIAKILVSFEEQSNKDFFLILPNFLVSHIENCKKFMDSYKLNDLIRNYCTCLQCKAGKMGDKIKSFGGAYGIREVSKEIKIENFIEVFINTELVPYNQNIVDLLNENLKNNMNNLVFSEKEYREEAKNAKKYQYLSSRTRYDQNLNRAQASLISASKMFDQKTVDLLLDCLKDSIVLRESIVYALFEIASKGYREYIADKLLGLLQHVDPKSRRKLRKLLVGIIINIPNLYQSIVEKIIKLIENTYIYERNPLIDVLVNFIDEVEKINPANPIIHFIFQQFSRFCEADKMEKVISQAKERLTLDSIYIKDLRLDQNKYKTHYLHTYYSYLPVESNVLKCTFSESITINLASDSLKKQLINFYYDTNNQLHNRSLLHKIFYSLDETPLMQASSQNDLVEIQRLVSEGTDTRCMNRLGLMAVNKAHNHIEVLKWLIEHHQPIDTPFLENVLSELECYHGEANYKNEDDQLLNKLVLMLTGLEEVSQKKQAQRKRLLAHFQSFSSNREQELEGLVGQEFLALHTYHLLQLLAEVKLGRHNHLLSASSRLDMISQIKRELLITVQAAHFGILSDIVRFQPTLHSAVAQAMLTALAKLSPGEELIYQTGYTSEPYGHCIYVAFRCEGNQIVARVDNLDDGIQNRHSEIRVSKQGRDVTRCKPYFVAEYAKANLIQNAVLKSYLINIIAARSLDRESSLDRIYPRVNQQTATAQRYLQTWPSKKAQIVGNCVVRSFFVGTHLRQGKALHQTLRSLESNLLTQAYPSLTQQVASANLNNTNTQRGAFTTKAEQTQPFWKTLVKTAFKVMLHSQIQPQSPPKISSNNQQTAQPQNTPIKSPPVIINSQQLTGTNQLKTKARGILSHTDLMHVLAKQLNIPFGEVVNGSTIEQTLVDATGINVEQINPRFRRSYQDQSTMFYLNFPNEKTKQQFINFYQNQCPGIILRTVEESNKTRIDFDTPLFIEKIIPILKVFRFQQINTFEVEERDRSERNFPSV